MSGMSFIGSYSGIDKNTIDQLMAAEKLPLVQLSNKKTTITEKQNAWKDVNTRLNSLFDKVKALQNKDLFNVKSSTSTNDKNVSMTAGKNAVAGTYKISVGKLATNSSVISGTIAGIDKDNTKALGINGDFDIVNKDGEKATINIKAEDSLNSIVSNINESTKETGISATIIDNRLVLNDAKTGKREITLIGDGKGTLTSLGLNMVSKKEIDGQMAMFSINGVDVTSDSNTVTGVIEGVTINLNKVTGSEEETITIAQDNSVVEKAVQEFVDQYNSTIAFIEDKLKAGDPKVAGSKGALSGDSSLMRLHSSLRNLVTSTVATPDSKSSITDISKLGVSTFDRFGQLKFDASKLKEALSEDATNVMNFFVSKEGEQDIGFAPRLWTYVDTFVSKSNGVIKGKTEGFEKTLKDLNTQMDNFSARMVKKEAYYIKRFTALDVALMKAESQMSWLEGQVNSMNGIKK